MIELYPSSAFDFYCRKKPHYSDSIDAVCKEINKACQGIGTNEAALIKLLGGRSLNERTLIAFRYKELFKSSLHDLISSETSGDFGYLLELLTLPLPQAEAFILHDALHTGSSTNVIYPIIMGRKPDELDLLKQVYNETYNESLAVAVKRRLTGDYEQVILGALEIKQLDYDANYHSLMKAEGDAENLFNAGENKFGTDENSFIRILISSPPEYLKLIDKMYIEKRKHGLVAAIKSEFKGEAQDALIFHVNSAINAVKLVTELIHDAIAGLGTDEKMLSSAVVRYQGALSRIASHYHTEYKKDLKQSIKDDTNGDYQDLLMRILDAPASHATCA